MCWELWGYWGANEPFTAAGDAVVALDPEFLERKQFMSMLLAEVIEQFGL